MTGCGRRYFRTAAQPIPLRFRLKAESQPATNPI